MPDAYLIDMSDKGYVIVDLGTHKVVKLNDGKLECIRGEYTLHPTFLNEHSLKTRIRNLRDQGLDASKEEEALLELLK